ncbi:hypothetical protein FC84_GL000375 [Lapidilactobacillus dextrinicus DSM 20335]|uniref:Extracellular protein n=1 Tax=Lapidilactobacillus dextrinicus DSM 20335 TaxID=1423738 RepID=A0A0R2BI02_9LACO|nr:hypothetical protein [Lapidilactobacillus dextrinicus]KRM78640.1 hypothetical protein FC84_GL000375 [Lapidilactobacillus dextrinicus DSM 20335]QFG46573.1 hypothetical protein LH506_03560 [Lapidilactobacillus dextrinicus]
MKKNLDLIIAAVIVALAAVFGVAYRVHQNNAVAAQNTYLTQVNQQIKTVNRSVEQMKTKKSDADKLTKLKKLEQDYKKYQQSEHHDSRLTNAYQKAIKKGQTIFVKQNQQQLKENTSHDLSKETQKSLQKKIGHLKTLRKTIKTQGQVVYDHDRLQTNLATIDQLLKTYKNKLTALDKQEDADKEAEEAAQAATAEANRQAEIAAAQEQATAAANAQASELDTTSSVTTDDTSSSSNSSTTTSSTDDYTSSSLTTPSYSQISSSQTYGQSNTTGSSGQSYTTGGNYGYSSGTTGATSSSTSSQSSYNSTTDQTNTSSTTPATQDDTTTSTSSSSTYQQNGTGNSSY